MITTAESDQIVNSYLSLRARWKLSSIFRELNDREQIMAPSNTNLLKQMLPYIPFTLAVNGNELNYTASQNIVSEDKALEGSIFTVSDAQEFGSFSTTGLSGDIRMVTPELFDIATSMFEGVVSDEATRTAVRASVYDSTQDITQIRQRFSAGIAELLQFSNGADYKRITMLMLKAWIEEPYILQDKGKLFWNLKSVSLTDVKHPEGITYWGSVEPGASFVSDADTFNMSTWSFTFKIVKEQISSFKRQAISEAVANSFTPAILRPASDIFIPPAQSTIDTTKQTSSTLVQDLTASPTEVPPPIPPQSVETANTNTTFMFTNLDRLLIDGGSVIKNGVTVVTASFSCQTLKQGFNTWITVTDSNKYSFSQTLTLSELSTLDEAKVSFGKIDPNGNYNVIVPNGTEAIGSFVQVDQMHVKLTISNMTDNETVGFICQNKFIHSNSNQDLLPYAFVFTSGAPCPQGAS